MALLQVLIDPVCFMTCYPHLLYNFVYKVPTLAESLFQGVPGIINGARYFFSRDLTIAEVRHWLPVIVVGAEPMRISECSAWWGISAM